MDTVCISLGGSVFSKEGGFNISCMRGISGIIKAHGNKHFIIVVGGGHASRLYLGHARGILKNNLVLDEIGMSFTKANAMLFRGFLRESGIDVYANDIGSIRDLREAVSENRIVVMGGLLPGITTDAVAVLACEAAGAKIMVNVSKEAYVYDRHPDEKGAKKIAKMDYGTLIRLASSGDAREAGTNFIFDIVASKLARRSGIRVYFVSDDPKELDAVISNRKHAGTVVG